MHLQVDLFLMIALGTIITFYLFFFSKIIIWINTFFICIENLQKENLKASHHIFIMIQPDINGYILLLFRPSV